MSCGRIARSQWGVIVNPDTGDELPDGEVGEIWLQGNNIGRGYWERPEETRLTFGAKLSPASRKAATPTAHGSKAHGCGPGIWACISTASSTSPAELRI